jgi:hypothetical protein
LYSKPTQQVILKSGLEIRSILLGSSKTAVSVEMSSFPFKEKDTYCLKQQMKKPMDVDV